jgi:transposase
MAIYCGVDFHARQQTICYCDTAGGEIRLAELNHERDDVGGFYAAFAGEVVVGIEASGYSTWFVELLEGLGHRVLVGDASEIRRLAKRRQKNDRRDAELILDLLLRGEFPQVHRPPFESREVLRWKTEKTRALHEWWARIAQRRGKSTAVIALAHKLAGIMFAVWRDGTQFDPLLLRSGGATAPPAAT